MRRGVGLGTSQAGFTLLEAIVTIVMIGLMASFLTPRISTSLQHARVNRAANTIATDLELAFAMAARERQPVRLTTTGATTYTISDRIGGTVRATRNLGATSEFRLDTLSFAPATIDVFPTGVSTAALTVVVTLNGYTRQVTMSRGGQIRVVPL
jgi:prepilin-type N-terminal cleavage/methylation domain-containing protein